jgi:hypothetical protein
MSRSSKSKAPVTAAEPAHIALATEFREGSGREPRSAPSPLGLAAGSGAVAPGAIEPRPGDSGAGHRPDDVGLDPGPCPELPAPEAADGPGPLEPRALHPADAEGLALLEGDRSFVALLAFYTDHLLRNRESVYNAIAGQRALGQLCLAMVALTVAFGGVYGLTLGAGGGAKQVVMSAVKVPALLFLTLAVTAPALYALNTILGSRIRFGQTVALACATMATMSVLLLALSPLSLFLASTGLSYPAMQLVQVALFFVAGYFGAFFLYDGMQTIAARLSQDQNLPLLQLWLCLYAYVGAQMAWVLRPFIGDPARPFAFRHPVEGSFFRAVAEALTAVFRS